MFWFPRASLVGITILCMLHPVYSLTFYGPFGRVNKGYLISAFTKSWPEARQICKDKGFSLAKIEDRAENADLHQLLMEVVGTNAVWLSGNDKEKDGHWYWDDGTVMEWTNWKNASFKRSNYSVDNYRGCLTFVNYTDGVTSQWDAEDCSIEKMFVCEISGKKEEDTTSAKETLLTPHQMPMSEMESATSKQAVSASPPKSLTSTQKLPTSDSKPNRQHKKLSVAAGDPPKMCFIVLESDGYKLICM